MLSSVSRGARVALPAAVIFVFALAGIGRAAPAPRP
jgi:hypothetical protein